MNTVPHTHQIRVTRFYETLNKGGYRITYGDTTVTVVRGPFLERRIRRGAKRAIKKHDQGSLNAAASVDRLAELNDSLKMPIYDGWGSDLLKRRAIHRPSCDE